MQGYGLGGERLVTATAFEQYLEGIGQPMTSPRIETVITQIPH